MSNEDIINELRKISKLLTFAHSDRVIIELEKIATTENRKKIWVLINGIRETDEIAKMIEVTSQAVRDFYNLAEPAGLVKYPRGRPASKIIDYVPPSWIELLPKDILGETIK